jgi:hypothetical protein
MLQNSPTNSLCLSVCLFERRHDQCRTTKERRFTLHCVETGERSRSVWGICWTTEQLRVDSRQDRFFSPPKHSNRSWRLFNGCRGHFSRGVKLTSLEPGLRMHGAVFPIPHTSSWRAKRQHYTRTAYTYTFYTSGAHPRGGCSPPKPPKPKLKKLILYIS